MYVNIYIYIYICIYIYIYIYIYAATSCFHTLTAAAPSARASSPRQAEGIALGHRCSPPPGLAPPGKPEV